MNQFLTVLVLAGATLLAGCATAPAIDLNFSKIRTLDEFRALVVDRELVADGFTGMNSADGKMRAKTRRTEIVGTWEWKDGYFCRDGTQNGQPLGYDCQLMEMYGNKLRVTRNKGAGKSFILTVTQ